MESLPQFLDELRERNPAYSISINKHNNPHDRVLVLEKRAAARFDLPLRVAKSGAKRLVALANADNRYISFNELRVDGENSVARFA
jgi:hypothetical protein